MTTSDLDRIRTLLDAPSSSTSITSMRIPDDLREAANELLQRAGSGESLSGLAVDALRSRLSDMYLDAALEQHYQQHPEDRPSLTEVAWAYARQQRFDVSEDDIRRAAEDAGAAGLDPTPRDVALWALASAQGPVPA